MKLTFSEDAMGDGPDGAIVVFDRLKDIQFTVTNDGELIGRGLILKDVGYYDREAVYLSFEDIWGEFQDEYYIVLDPRNNYGEGLVLEYS